jgi:hypothetical protein
LNDQTRVKEFLFLVYGAQSTYEKRLHVKFCKYVLEVSRRSTNIAIAGELGRYPLFLEVILNMRNYFIPLIINYK